MERRNFVKKLTLASTALSASRPISAAINTMTDATPDSTRHNINKIAPRAITMWDFSWLERRWPGAGYEDWDLALSQLKERGYNAVRIDAYPHLLAAGAEKEWTLKEVWSIQNWGSPDIVKVKIQPYLNEFITVCKKYDIKVGLSSWFREDADNTRMKITTPEKHAEIWLKTLDSIKKADYWKNMLVDFVQRTALHAGKAGLPLVTTECWGIVDYKDWPLLSWDWVKELCALGTITAAQTGGWMAIATSNFCGPQFVGMWRDIEWHQKLTHIIKSTPLREDLFNDKIKKALI